jgi:site-specific DNA recombinase
MKRAIAYLRKSTDLQETSLEQQKEKVLEFAREHSVRVIEIFAEEACGENVEGRPEFRKMIECCKSNEDFQYVFVYDISRWGRFENPKEAVYWEVEVERAGRKVVFISEGFKEDNIGTSISNFVKSAEASEYLKNIRRQTVRGMMYHANKGFWMGGRPPYGYDRAIIEDGKVIEVLKEGKQKNIKDQKIKLVINEEQTKAVKTIFIMFAKQGLSVHSIVTYLNNQSQFVPARGRMWSKSSIWRILHNEVYIGTLVYNRENGHKRHGKYKYNPQEEWVMVKNAHEPIIQIELWEMVKLRTKQAFAGGKFIVSGNRPGSEYLLSGLIKCGECGYNFHGGRRKNKDSITRVYRCGGYNLYGSDICSRLETNAKSLEDFIISHIQKKIDNPVWRNELKKELLEILQIAEKRSGARLCEIDKEIKELSLKIENWKMAIEKGLELDNVVNIINKYSYQREQLYREKNRTIEKAKSGSANAIADKMLSYLDDFKDILEHGAPERKKDFIRKFVKSVIVYPKLKQAKILLYAKPLSDTIREDKQCGSTEEIIYQN